MQIHKMKLVPEAFENIKNGTKRIEIRLNDEKRKLINIGDEIIFEEVKEEPRTIKTKVLNLIHTSSFEELLNTNKDMSVFYDDKISKEELLKLYYTFYTHEDEKKYGVLGIEIEIEE